MTNWDEFNSGKKGVVPDYKTQYVVSAKQNAYAFGGVQEFRFDTPSQANAFAKKVAKY